MAYKDRMIASRSIAAAVREARIEMKKLGDSVPGKPGAKAAARGSSLPAPHRRGVPTATRLREAVRRDLPRGETKRSKGAGYDTYDALVTVFGDEVEGLLDTEIAALEDELKATMASEDLEAIAAAVPADAVAGERYPEIGMRTVNR